jgi:ribosomal protein S18 acetylase RimI-like enzyme
MDIRKAVYEDIADLVALINSAYRDTSKKGWTTEADLLDGIRTDEANIAEMMNENGGFFLKCLNDHQAIIGCVYLQQQNDKLYLGMLAVNPELQGSGIGKRFLSAAIEQAKDNNCVAVTISVISVRDELIAWYEKHGFKKTGKTKPFPIDDRLSKQKQPVEFIFMEKKL